MYYLSIVKIVLEAEFYIQTAWKLKHWLCGSLVCSALNELEFHESHSKH